MPCSSNAAEKAPGRQRAGCRNDRGRLRVSPARRAQARAQARHGSRSAAEAHNQCGWWRITRMAVRRTPVLKGAFAAEAGGAGANPTDAGSRDSGATSTRTDSGCSSPPNCDDKDPCTIDELTRGVANCNTACMHADHGASGRRHVLPQGRRRQHRQGLRAQVRQRRTRARRDVRWQHWLQQRLRIELAPPDQMRCLQDY